MKAIVRYLIVSLLIGLLLIGCSFSNADRREKDEIISLTGNVTFNHKIDSLLHLFVQKANCEDCCYEMFIDKRDPEDTMITLVAKCGNYFRGEKDQLEMYLKLYKPSIYTKVGNKTIFIITGVEDLISLDSPSKELGFMKRKSSYYEYGWVIKIIRGEFSIYEDTIIPPFSKLDFCGVIKFEAPDSDNDSIGRL